MAVFAIGAFLLLSGGFALAVGVHDATLRDEPFGVTIAGAALIGVGLLLLAAGIAWTIFALNLAQIEVWSGQLILAACLVTAVASGYFLLAELRSLEQSNVVLGVASIALIGGLGSFFVAKHLTGVTLTKVGAFLLSVFGLAFGVFQFWYAEQYVPSHTPTALSLQADLKPIGVQSDRELYRATLKLKNTGKVKVIAFTGTYLVSGFMYKRVAAADDPPRGLEELRARERKVVEPLAKDAPDPFYARYSRHFIPLGFTPVTGGKLFAENRYFEPDQELTREFTIAVPGCYDALLVRANVVVAKGALLRVDDDPAISHKQFDETYVAKAGRRGLYRSGVYVEWHVEDDSWVRDIVDGKDRWIEVVWAHFPFGSQSSYFEAGAWIRSGDKNDDRTLEALEAGNKDAVELTLRAKQELGLATTFAHKELPVTGARRAPCPGAKEPAPAAGAGS